MNLAGLPSAGGSGGPTGTSGGGPPAGVTGAPVGGGPPQGPVSGTACEMLGDLALGIHNIGNPLPTSGCVPLTSGSGGSGGLGVGSLGTVVSPGCGASQSGQSRAAAWWEVPGFTALSAFSGASTAGGVAGVSSVLAPRYVGVSGLHEQPSISAEVGLIVFCLPLIWFLFHFAICLNSPFLLSDLTGAHLIRH
ncbi:unnamed protein product [Protopolystoma xenopodis]|uniref:Uncharacterized protein n=1 Tax=Protopolystoma xenopodis TaxID=117903 RepID=A0A448X751_9PLAT|nr:unnamed protein product [Protopolystoma xenopodis]